VSFRPFYAHKFNCNFCFFVRAEYVTIYLQGVHLEILLHYTYSSQDPELLSQEHEKVEERLRPHHISGWTCSTTPFHHK